MDVLVVGSGGREHALSWKLSQSPLVDTVFVAPGNGGTRNNIDIAPDDINKLAAFAKEKKCFTVIGPEMPLSLGIVDHFKKQGLEIFGPTQNAAQLESSKIWAKNFMKRNDIPTAPFEIFDDAQSAISYIHDTPYGLVVKADGLASGKGVVVCSDKNQAIAAVEDIMIKKKFGPAGDKIIIEKYINGVEASYIAISDGTTTIPMASSQDHKRIHDGEKGLNTGGMGAYSPSVIDDAMSEKIQTQIIDKTISSMKKEGVMFSGFLYAGVMIKDDTPFVLEYNVRMGDPECQPITMRMDFDLFKYLYAASRQHLDTLPAPTWKKQSAVCVVLASKGYPEKYPIGEPISNIPNDSSDVIVFHAGTKNIDGLISSNGGRVLGVTALGDSLSSAITSAYGAVDSIKWASKFCRSDIGQKGL